MSCSTLFLDIGHCCVLRMAQDSSGYTVTWETPVGEDGQGIASILVQDTDPSFDYQPAEAWSTSPSNVTQYKDGTGQSFATYQNVLYHANNLGPGKHTINVTNSGQELNIDYAEVMVLTENVSTGAAVGLAVLGVATLFLSGALVWMWRQLKMSRSQYVDLYRSYAQRPPDSVNFSSSIMTNTTSTPDPHRRSRGASSDKQLLRRIPSVGEGSIELQPQRADNGIRPNVVYYSPQPERRSSYAPTISTALPEYRAFLSAFGYTVLYDLYALEG
ncbi:hypothetical protein CONPUDRAFT_146882 [Coniophora puteana RWD-64-598 SS2]|uniref:Uncharacterized protein n=1 Tax=Coniophora puteana (strain RWD-64-598) TaxID=741705 RepID=A0A5M3MB83_CONPW|nr:uncharacterized protein CONPUDRAFT_146882 [Coniophora puteana RWD-64-598 SS2]EIW76489.1 hypothetical protein CONPUDRAFT_146882 [Coniophora puteana RWD-64-598 SS2]